MLAELKDFTEELPDEIDRLKGRIKRSLIIQQESSPSRAGSIALIGTTSSRVRTMSELSRIIDSLTADGINAYLAANVRREFDRHDWPGGGHGSLA
jgi:predicted Zn-dependent peptidase